MRSNIFNYFILIVLFFSCKEESPVNEILIIDNTPEMVDELRAIAQQTSNINVWHLNRLRAQALDNQIKQITDPGQRLSLQFRSAAEWLNAGDYNKSLERSGEILKFLDENKLSIPKQSLKTIKELHGIAYMRKAEIENCINHHNEYSCILPIEKDGIHTEKGGAQNASEIFASMLGEDPANIQAKWLYNIAQMALGKYPDQVDPDLLIDDSVFDSDIEFPRFTDQAMGLGLAINDISGSVVMDDFNNDNYLDLMISSYGLDDQLRYFENTTTGSFVDKTEQAGIKGLWSGLNMVQADYDNDGYIDVFILRGAWLGKDGQHPNSLLRNNGNGTFSDVTKASGLYCHFPTQTASWADFNNDGWIDLFIANEHSQNVHAPCQLFMNNADGTFSDVAIEKSADIKDFIKSCVWGDYNNDGYQDLYLSSINGFNHLLKNLGPENDFKFEEVTNSSNTAWPEKSFPCWFFDYDQGGWEDLMVNGFDFNQFESAAGEVAKDYLGQNVSAELPVLYKNNGNGTFTNVTEQMGLSTPLFTMGCNFGDLDNDGYPDFYAATGTPDFRALIPNRMFLNGNGKKFLDVTRNGGFGHLQKGHGVAFGDIDMDGDQDVYNVLGGSYDGDNFMNALFINPGSENNWIKLKLIGSKSNKAAIGARVKITATNKNGETRVFFNRVNSGASFGANPLLVEQGLKDFVQIESIEITWPFTGSKQTIKNCKINTFYKIIEGLDTAEEILITPLNLKGNEQHDHTH